MRPPPPFGELLAKTLLERQVTMTALADSCGVSLSFAYKLKQGLRVPPSKLILPMADRLGLTGKARAEFIDAAHWAAVPEHVRPWLLAKTR